MWEFLSMTLQKCWNRFLPSTRRWKWYRYSLTIWTMKDFQPLNDTELAAIKKVQDIFKGMNLIPCTACRYCTDVCPKHIAIPDLFAVMNTKQLYHDWNADYYYNNVHTSEGCKASDCIKCGKCEKACPQHLPIRKLLEDVAAEFEKN